MKNIFYLMIVLMVALSATSCQEDLEIWDSETLDYSGRFVVKLMSEDMATTIIDYDGSEMLIYNTAENVANNVWIDDHGSYFPLKSKFIFTGNSSSFKSVTEDFSQLSDNIFPTEVLPTSDPTSAGVVTEGKELYVRASVLEGKIIPDAATSIGGNQSDSLFLKIRLYSNTATYTSYEIPVDLREDPNVAEFAWRFTSATYNPELDETYVIGGYRYTGMPEDHF